MSKLQLLASASIGIIAGLLGGITVFKKLNKELKVTRQTYGNGDVIESLTYKDKILKQTRFTKDGCKYMVTTYDDKTALQTTWSAIDPKTTITEYYDGVVQSRIYYYANSQKSSEYIRLGDSHRRTNWYENGIIRDDIIMDDQRSKIIRIFALNDPEGRNVILDEGEIIVWKACTSSPNPADMEFVYVKLLVPAEAQRVTPLNHKYKSRVSQAKVLEIHNREGKPFNEAHSFLHDKNMVYKLGEAVYPNEYDPSINRECAPGINVHKYKDHCLQWLSAFEDIKKN